ncbi:hypothetical protein [Gordonia sp. VNK21]|uniref:hypothetical protein n=1 Tax=Gordonia sp. VNK21 TaxID=3382483 RepID=UPI0038D4DDF0
MDLEELFRMDDGSPHVVRSDEVEAIQHLDEHARRRLWKRVGVVPTFEWLSRMFADLDLSRMTNSDDDVVLDFLSEVSEPARSQTTRKLTAGHAVLHPVPLFLAIKEVIVHADMDGEDAPTHDELLAVFLSLSAETHESAMPADPTQFGPAFGEMTLNRLMQTSLLYPDPLELVAGTAHATWHRGWSERTSARSLSDLAAGPSEQWTEVMGVELDDFLALGWLFYNLWKHEGVTRFDPDLFERDRLPSKPLKFLVDHCSISLVALRDALQQQRNDKSLLWTRYQMQQHPFVRLDDGTLIPIRFQFVIQRIFGDHLFLESAFTLRGEDKKKAKHYEDAMRDIFEERVGDVLTRICEHDQSGKTVLIEEAEMKDAWRTSKATEPKVCDFAVFREHGCLLVDANMRSLPQSFAEGTATIEQLQTEIRDRFTSTKFQQLLSTVDQFMAKGWESPEVPLTSRTRFVPVVVVPDAGMPSELTVENLMFAESLPLVVKYNDNPRFYRVHVPAVLTFRDLLMLDGLAERGVDVFALLKRWRNIHPLGRNGRQPLPVALKEFVDERHPGAPMGQAEHRRGWDMVEYLRSHLAQMAVDAAPPILRESLAQFFAEQQKLLPTFENRGEFVERNGRAVRRTGSGSDET